jgi:hypothetical protein
MLEHVNAGGSATRGVAIMTKLLSRTSRTEAQAFFEETYPFPSVVAALAALGLGDVAIAVSMVLSLS